MSKKISTGPSLPKRGKKRKPRKGERSFAPTNSELRNRAENKLSQRTAKKQGLSFKDTQPVIHELQVHQIELEMQNEELRRAQIELEESRKKYSDLYDFAPVGYFTFDKNKLILEANLTGAALLGLEKSALIKKPFSRFIHPEDQDLFYLHCRKVFESISNQTCEIRLKSKGSSQIHIHMISIPVKDHEGTCNRIRTAVSNVTEKMKLEKENIHLASFPKRNPNPVVELDSLGEITYMNPAATKQFPDLMVKGTGHPLCTDLSILREMFKTGEKVSHVREIKVGNGWYEQAISYIKESSHIRFYVHDITERKIIEAALYKAHEELELMVIKRTASLRESNELLENVFSNVHVLIVYMDTDFNFLRVNSKYAKSEGKEPEFYAGKNYFDLYPNEENKVIFRKVAETGEPYFAKAKPYVHAGYPGQQMTFWNWSLKPVKEADGRISGLVLSLVDVTDNITLYSELMRSEHLASVGKLAAGVAHEVNNPITGIINYAQMLVNKFDEESKEHDIATRIIKESDRIAGIVRSLLSFARESKEENKPVHITEILSDSLLLTETQLKKSGIRLEINIHKDLPLIIAQPQHIEQVFINLISNACYALNQKYPEAYNGKLFRISAESVKILNKTHVRVTFYDQGTGIPSAIKDKIMDPFFTTKTGGEGTGLGLSISHGIINDHCGRIEIDSDEGEFTKVVIDLPAQNDQ